LADPTVAARLEALGLARYAPAFEAEDITLDVLPELSDADLKELGVATLGERKRMLKAFVMPPATPSASPAPAKEAERRQLTVMFCDMVGSTALAARLDPEDLQKVMRSFHDAVARAVAPYEGHVAQLLGDGVLIYFGYPRAHEDDAERAVRAARAALEVVARLSPHGDVRLQTRMGIATGLVVVGEIGAGTPAAELTASGETPNLAARLQARAAPGEIVLADETRNLVRASFDTESLGMIELKGFAAPVPAWRVVAERTVASRFEARHESELIRLIGRDSEVALLLERWALAREGEGQAVLLSGEAGIGKSRITHALRERLVGESAATVLMQCSPYFTSSALYPLVQYFERVAGMQPDDDEATRTAKLARLAGSEIEFPALSFGYLLRALGLPDGGRVPAALSDGDAAQRETALMLQAPIDLLRGLSRHHPVLLLVEDAHWIDPTSEALVAQSIEQLVDARVLIVITCRPEYTPAFGNPAHLTRLALNRLGQKSCAALVGAVSEGKPLPPEVLAEIIRKTDGIPLFVEELTKTVLQSGLLREEPDGWRLDGPLPQLAIPSTLQDSLMARLDRLAPAKEVAQVGALIGREFDRGLLGAVLQMPEERLGAALDELVRAELLVPREIGAGASYAFKHALIRDTASGSLLKSQWVLRHGQIAAAIEASQPDIALAQPELLAHHWQEGGNPARAFECWVRAGDLATRRIALREAATHYRAALAMLPAVQGQGSALELELHMKLGGILMQTDGYGAPQTAACFDAGRALARSLGQIDVFALACAGLGANLWAKGSVRAAIEMQAQLSAADVPRLQPMSRFYRASVVGLSELHLGELSAAWAHTREASEQLEQVPQAEVHDVGGVDARVLILAQSVAVGVHLGLLDQSDAMTERALEIARERGHEPTRAWALGMARWRAWRRGEHAAAVRIARESLQLAERLGFHTRVATAQLMLGRALVSAGEVEPGAKLLREGYAQWVASGARATASEYASHAAEVLIDAGRPAEALPFLLAGERAQGEIEERFYAAELLRQRGRLIEARVVEATAEDAEAHYRRALDVAQAQGARLFALRAASELARLLGERGRAAEGDALLRPIYEAFEEGRDYPELRRARALLG
jgi:class 3 adenylate cyclase/tetratricopeptide (TPR) repeat protein